MDPERIAQIKAQIQRIIDGGRGDGMSDAQVDSMVSSYLSDKHGLTPQGWQDLRTQESRPPAYAFSPAIASEQQGKGLGGVAREVAQGLTLGFSDEIEAALTPQSLEDVQAQRQEHAEGGGSVVLPQLAGGVMTGALTGGAAGATILSKLSALRKAAAFGGIGAAEGAVAGAGSAQPGERAAGAKTGALLGAGFGFGFPAATGLTSSGVRTIRDVVSPNVAREGQMALSEAMQPALRQGQKFTDLVANQGDVAADVALEGQFAGARALRDRPDNMGDIARNLTARNEGLAPALGAAADQMANTPAGRSRIQRLEQLRATRRATLNNKYQQAYQAGVVTDAKVSSVVAEIAKDETTAPALASVRRRFQLGDTDPLTAEHLDILVRELDDAVKGSFRSGRPPGAMREYRDDLRDRLVKVVPGYSEARQAAAAMNAAERAGREAPKWKGAWKAADIEYNMGRWSPGEKEEFAFGVAADLEAEMSKRLSRDNLSSAFAWLRNMRPRLTSTFGGPEASTFYDEVARLQRQFETFAEARRGVRGAARAGAERSDAASQVATGIGYLANKMAGAAFRTGVQSVVRSPAQQRAFSEEIARTLFQTPPAHALSMLDEAVPLLESLRRRQAATQGTQAALGGQLGGILGGGNR